MTRKNKLTFLFPPDKDGDHPDIQWETYYTGRTSNMHKGNQKDTRDDTGPARQPSWSRETKNEDTPILGDVPEHKETTRRPSLPPSRYGRRSKIKMNKERSRPVLSLPKLRVGSKLALIAASAVALGVMMGMMVLSLFAGEGTDGSQGGSAQAPAAVSEDGADNGALVMPAGYVQDSRLYLPSRTYYVVQAGAFSEQQAAQKVKEQVQNQGLAGLVPPGEAPFRLYMGLGAARDDAERLGAYLEEQGIEVYIHVHETREVQVDIGNLAESYAPLPAYLARGDQLLGELTRTTALLLEQSDAELTEEKWQALQEQHRLFLNEGRGLLSGLGGETAQAGEQLMRTLSAAVTALEAYRKQSHPGYLWQAQQAGLNYLTYYEQLVNQFDS